jgi:hypothetical protein
MNLATVIELSAAALGLYSGVFFCVGVLHVKDSTLETIATSMWGKGITIATELARQKSEFIFGASLLFLSFLVQVAGKFLSPEVAATVVASSPLRGAALGFAGPTIVLLLFYIPFRRHRTKSVRNLMAAVEGKV